ncbi:MAG: T9SS type A sorting domain-containing protein [Saprospiraceae bacterium]|nr:T9SS type A sorting domain-containing protein [Saprospiraceae bacterium]
MQQRFFCLILSFIGYFVHAQQSIFPVLANAPKWCVVTTNYNGGNPLFFYHTNDYFYLKDTILDGKSYSQLGSKYDYYPAKGALIRNEGKKTFIRRVIPNQTPTRYSQETLLYNFDMKTTKDSFFVSNVYGSGGNTKIDSIIVKYLSTDTVEFNSVRRRRMKVEYRTNDRSYKLLRPLFGEWIEGFGSYRNPFYDFIKYDDSWTEVMGMDLNGLREYENHQIANGCSPKRSNTEDNTLTGVQIYPNPVHQSLTIDMTESLPSARVEIALYDVLGHLVHHQHLMTNTSPLSIDLSHLQTGLYMLFLQSTDKRLATKIIVQND